MITDREDKASAAKKKNRPPAFSQAKFPTQTVNKIDILANLSNSCEMNVNGVKIVVDIKDLIKINNLGEGQFGVVDKMRHGVSGQILAVKKIRCSASAGGDTEKEHSRLLNDINIGMRGSCCPYLIVSYGAMFKCGDVWICMEVMDISLDKLYRKLSPETFIPESLLAFITFSIVMALEYLCKELKVIHRDVKPSNILLDREGRVKVCDFGISGYLINSLATTDVGSQPYLAPERISPDRSSKEYGIRSDVWSLGISVLEVAIKRFPYSKWNSFIEQIKEVVHGVTSPTLPPDSAYSPSTRKFIARCLVKNVSERAKYDELLKHALLRPFYGNSQHVSVTKMELARYVSRLLLDSPPTAALSIHNSAV